MSSALSAFNWDTGQPSIFANAKQCGTGAPASNHPLRKALSTGNAFTGTGGQIKPLHTLTREERRALAQAAADRGDQIQQACPFAAGSPEYDDFEDDFLRRRHTLLTPCE